MTEFEIAKLEEQRMDRIIQQHGHDAVACLGDFRVDVVSIAGAIRLAEAAAGAAMTQPRHFLREWRKYRRLKLVRVAAEIHMPHSSLSRIERGEYGYGQSHLEALAAVYQTTPADLLAINPLSRSRR
jgi:hypothetical protein